MLVLIVHCCIGNKRLMSYVLTLHIIFVRREQPLNCGAPRAPSRTSESSWELPSQFWDLCRGKSCRNHSPEETPTVGKRARSPGSRRLQKVIQWGGGVPRISWSLCFNKNMINKCAFCFHDFLLPFSWIEHLKNDGENSRWVPTFILPLPQYMYLCGRYC